MPLVEVDLHVTRTEFEAAARPLLDRTTATTVEVLRSAGVTRERTAGVFLVGGSSRIPLVAALLHQRLGIAPTVIDQPELVVAHGALHIPAQPGTRTPPPTTEPAAAVPRAAPTVTTSQRPAVLGIPPRGVVSSDFPVHLVELMIGGRVGYTVRTYPDDGETAVFASVGDRLPLFARPEQAGDYAAGTDGHAMTAVLHWEALAETMTTAFLPLLPHNRYRLDLPSVTLERHPKEWLVDLVVEAGIVTRELVNALGIDEAHALLGEGTPLDRLDDALRVARRIPFGRRRRELRAFDHRALAAEWRRVADLIGDRIDWW